MQNKISYSIIPYSFKDFNGVELHSIGCEMSTVDSFQIYERIPKEDLHEKVIIVSTCTVVESAFWTSIQLVRKLHLLYPAAKIYVTGCAIKYDYEAFSKYDVHWFHTQDNSDFSECKNMRCIIPDSKRGLIKIQEGCSKACSYCIVRKLRGNARSVPVDIIESQIRNLVNSGYKSIYLVGTELCYYDYDGISFPALLKKILIDFPEIDELSFDALDPGSDCIEEVIDIVKGSEKIQNTMCLAVQAGTDEILKLMNRRHTCDRLRKIMSYAGNDFDIFWHLIVGFPGETEELFKKGIQFIEEVKPKFLYINPYSNVEGTISYSFPNQVPKEEIDRRVSILQKMNKDIFKYREGYAVEHHEQKITQQDVTFEIDEIISDKSLALLNSRGEGGNLQEVVQFKFDQSCDMRELELNIKYLYYKYGTRFFTKIELTDEVSQKISRRELDTFLFKDFLCLEVSFLVPDKYDIDILKCAIIELYKEDKTIILQIKSDFLSKSTYSDADKKLIKMLDMLSN